MEKRFRIHIKITMMRKKIVLTGVVLVLLSIVLGAFGAHKLKELIDVKDLQTFETGVKYQMYIGLSFLIIGFNGDKIKTHLSLTVILIGIGILLFSGSIYFLSLKLLIGDWVKYLGPVTPIGGLLMIIGWILIFIQILKDGK